MTSDISDNQFNNLWQSGLGSLFCIYNSQDLDVHQLELRINTYIEKVRTYALIASVLLIIGIVSIGVCFTGYIDHTDLRHFFRLSIGFFVGSIGFITKAFRYFKASHKLKEYDLSGFDIESYVPCKRNLKRKAIEWGVAKRHIRKTESGWKFVSPLHQAPTTQKTNKSIYIFIVSITGVIVCSLFLGFFFFNFFFGELIPKDVTLTGKAYRLKDIYIQGDVLYDRKTGQPATGTLLLAKKSERRIYHITQLKKGIENGYGWIYRWKGYHDSWLKTRYTMTDGKRTGPVIDYYASGKIESEGHLKDNVLEGLKTYFFETGGIESQVFFMNGKKDGFQYYYNQKGTLLRVSSFQNGAHISTTFYDR